MGLICVGVQLVGAYFCGHSEAYCLEDLSVESSQYIRLCVCAGGEYIVRNRYSMIPSVLWHKHEVELPVKHEDFSCYYNYMFSCISESV